MESDHVGERLQNRLMISHFSRLEPGLVDEATRGVQRFIPIGAGVPR